MLRSFLALLLLLLVAGCNLGSSGAPVPTTTPVNGVVQSTTLSSPRVIAWNPNTNTLGWVLQDNNIPLENGVPQRAVVQYCGAAPDGAHVIVAIGGDTAQPALYPVNGGERVMLGQTSGLACTLQKRIYYSPDGKRLGLLQYTPGATNGNYVVGTLRILTAEDNKNVYMVNEVTSFEMYDDGVLYTQLYSNGQGQAKTAALRWWNGTTEQTLEDPIQSLENCQIVSARAVRMGEKVYSLLGEKCQNKGSSWRLMRTDFSGGNSSNIETGQTGGAYFTNAGTNDLWPLAATSEMLVAYPNGLAADVVNLIRVSLADGTVKNVINSVTIDQYPPSMSRRFLASPDKQRLIFVTRDGNGGEALYMYSLLSPDEAPTLIAGGNRSDRINGVAWSADSQRVYYVLASDINALSVFTLAGESKLIVRGIFQGLALSPDGTLAATSEQVRVDTNDVRNNLVVIDTTSQQKTVLVEGGRGESALTPLVVR
ncbi:MAG: hypothetical protein KF716_17920 [Anaerolineae bacterium]|nr:hypothetical protein [Anaerolineae bacterium]